VFVEAGVGETRGLFLLDTGAAATVLDPRFAEAAFVHLGRPREIEGRGGDVGARQAAPVRLTLQGGPGARVEPVVTDLSQASAAMQVPLAGILGEDFLRNFVLTVDYRGQRLFVDAPNVGSGEADPADAVPLRFGDTPYVMARVVLDGRVADGEFEIDTGSNTAVEFWRGFSRDRLGGARGARDVGLGVAGQSVIERGRIDALQVAGRTIAAPQVNFADDARPGDARDGYAGVIGGPAWRGLVLTLDLPNQRMWLR
jgi:predicted aspartyl protease